MLISRDACEGTLRDVPPGALVEHGVQSPAVYRLRRRGFRVSLSPSPSRLMASTVRRMAIPGIVQSHHALRRKVRPAPIMKPQLMVFGSPSPRNDSADSMRIAVATMREPVTMIGERQLGRRWRKKMRPSR